MSTYHYKSHPDNMTFAVDWALKNNSLSTITKLHPHSHSDPFCQKSVNRTLQAVSCWRHTTSHTWDIKTYGKLFHSIIVASCPSKSGRIILYIPR